MPSAGRKFLMAGRGGLNLTHSEALPRFLDRYAGDPLARDAVMRHPPAALVDWVHGLGVPTFTGSSGRIFPAGMKASPLLRAWLGRLVQGGVEILLRTRVDGMERDPAGAWRVHSQTTNRRRCDTSPTVVLALGGASWSRLGSDGSWTEWLAGVGVQIVPFSPVNVGLCCDWPPGLTEPLAGAPLKPVVLRVLGTPPGLPAGPLRGECILTTQGLEGGVVYALGQAIRALLARNGRAQLEFDLVPDLSTDELAARLAAVPTSRSFSERLRRAGRLSGARLALATRLLPTANRADPVLTAAGCKALTVSVTGLAPLDSAISTAGGVNCAAHDAEGMLHALPGVYCAGEMLDWEAPTGGYLLTACIATGWVAGAAAARRALGLGALPGSDLAADGKA
ncbi:MAG TPA: aminoacetone oxidase family FAD-binding enzyme, partial [Gammaproteobacteria bacterium]|nr:aminoacetone oxidase family FAD-binding enzyme [Gammaproteobacteria bacterium]